MDSEFSHAIQTFLKEICGLRVTDEVVDSFAKAAVTKGIRTIKHFATRTNDAAALKSLFLQLFDALEVDWNDFMKHCHALFPISTSPGDKVKNESNFLPLDTSLSASFPDAAKDATMIANDALSFQPSTSIPAYQFVSPFISQRTRMPLFVNGSFSRTC